MSSMTRRTFLKRSGGATVAVLVVSHEFSRKAYANVPQPGSSAHGMIVVKICVLIRRGIEVLLPQQEPEGGWKEWFDELSKNPEHGERDADVVGIERAEDDGTWTEAPAGTFHVSKIDPAGKPASVRILNADGDQIVYTDNAKLCHIRMVKK